MALYDSQYRPIADAEIDGDSALSSRTVRDMAYGINNAKGAVGLNLITHATPGGYLSSVTTAQTAVWKFAPRWIGDGYNRILWTIGAAVSSGAGVKFRLYAGQGFYHGSSAITTADLFEHMGFFWFSSQTITATGWDNYVRTDLVPVPDTTGLIYLMLTAESTSGSTNYQLGTLCATAKIVE